MAGDSDRRRAQRPAAEIDGMPLDAALDGLEGPKDYPALVTALDARGYQGDDLAAMLGGNFVRVLRDAVGRA
jgi:microsomal dipeptidase-like Zn-dependent dipeptidase